jgi:hypothetical protein
MLQIMRKLRILLTLLLCLTIPVAGWASVMSGFMGMHNHSPHIASDIETHSKSAHSDHEQSVASDCGNEHQHAHCSKLAGNHGNPAKSCRCGCGMGTCTSSSLSLMSPLPDSFKLFNAKEIFPQTKAAARVAARGTSPLRPPIA